MSGAESGQVNVHAAWRTALARHAAVAYAGNAKFAALAWLVRSGPVCRWPGHVRTPTSALSARSCHNAAGRSIRRLLAECHLAKG